MFLPSTYPDTISLPSGWTLNNDDSVWNFYCSDKQLKFQRDKLQAQLKIGKTLLVNGQKFTEDIKSSVVKPAWPDAEIVFSWIPGKPLRISKEK